MSTRTQVHTELEQGLELAAGAGRSEPGGRAERSAGGPAAPTGGPRARSRRELSPGLVDDALDRARLRSAVELPDGGRLPDEVIDELLAGARTEEEIVGPGGLLAQLTRRLVERAMEVELTEHLGYEPHQEPPGGVGNTRNGSTPKTLATEHGPVGSTRRATATARLSRGSSRSASGVLRGSTRSSSRSIPVGCRCATSRRTWPRSTA